MKIDLQSLIPVLQRSSPALVTVRLLRRDSHSLKKADYVGIIPRLLCSFRHFIKGERCCPSGLHSLVAAKPRKTMSRKFSTSRMPIWWRVCDREPIMAEQLGSRYDVRQCYSDYGEMLEKERPDVVHITAPPQVHLGLATMAFESGCHVLIEKPATCSYAATEQLLSRAEATGRKLTVAWGAFRPDCPRHAPLVAVGGHWRGGPFK